VTVNRDRQDPRPARLSLLLVHRAKRARDAAALRLNQIVCGHAAEVMAGWPSKSIDLIITSPPYWDAVIYDGRRTRSAGVITRSPRRGRPVCAMPGT
jgi:hypothetical protein